MVIMLLPVIIIKDMVTFYLNEVIVGCNVVNDVGLGKLEVILTLESPNPS